LLGRSSLEAQVLLEIGRGFNCLEGDQVAACWYRAGLAEAQQHFKDTAPDDPSARTLLHLLDQTKALWRLRDYVAMEMRFALAMRLNAPLTAEARRSAHLHAEMLYYRGKVQEAADAILAVQAQHQKVGDLGVLDRSDLDEMNWSQGLLLYSAQRVYAALPYFERTIAHNGEHAREAAKLLIIAYSRCGKGQEAERCLEQYRQKYGPSAAEEQYIVSTMQKVKGIPIRQ
jgi:tetratricopeptide (TPR) repeat protein